MAVAEEVMLSLHVGEYAYVCNECETPTTIKASTSSDLVHKSTEHLVQCHPESQEAIRFVALSIDSFLPLGQSRVDWARAMLGDKEALAELAARG